MTAINPAERLIVGNDPSSLESNIAVAKALASLPRQRILDFLVTRTASLSEIARDLDMPIATASQHLKSLENSGLVSSHTAPGIRGRQRIFTRLYDIVVIRLPRATRYDPADEYDMRMPVGAFSRHHVVSPCGMATEGGLIGDYDDVIGFYDPDRFQAQLVWLAHGFLEYIFPNRAYAQGPVKSLHAQPGNLF